MNVTDLNRRNNEIYEKRLRKQQHRRNHFSLLIELKSPFGHDLSFFLYQLSQASDPCTVRATSSFDFPFQPSFSLIALPALTVRARACFEWHFISVNCFRKRHILLMNNASEIPFADSLQLSLCCTLRESPYLFDNMLNSLLGFQSESLHVSIQQTRVGVNLIIIHFSDSWFHCRLQAFITPESAFYEFQMGKVSQNIAGVVFRNALRGSHIVRQLSASREGTTTGVPRCSFMSNRGLNPTRDSPPIFTDASISNRALLCKEISLPDFWACSHEGPPCLSPAAESLGNEHALLSPFSTCPLSLSIAKLQIQLSAPKSSPQRSLLPIHCQHHPSRRFFHWNANATDVSAPSNSGEDFSASAAAATLYWRGSRACRYLRFKGSKGAVNTVLEIVCSCPSTGHNSVGRGSKVVCCKYMEWFYLVCSTRGVYGKARTPSQIPLFEDHNLHFDFSSVACESHYSSRCSNVSLTTAFLHYLPEDCGYSKVWCAPSLITIMQEPRLRVRHIRLLGERLRCCGVSTDVNPSDLCCSVSFLSSEGKLIQPNLQNRTSAWNVAHIPPIRRQQQNFFAPVWEEPGSCSSEASSKALESSLSQPSPSFEEYPKSFLSDVHDDFSDSLLEPEPVKIHAEKTFEETQSFPGTQLVRKGYVLSKCLFHSGLVPPEKLKDEYSEAKQCAEDLSNGNTLSSLCSSHHIQELVGVHSHRISHGYTTGVSLESEEGFLSYSDRVGHSLSDCFSVRAKKKEISSKDIASTAPEYSSLCGSGDTELTALKLELDAMLKMFPAEELYAQEELVFEGIQDMVVESSEPPAAKNDGYHPCCFDASVQVFTSQADVDMDEYN